VYLLPVGYAPEPGATSRSQAKVRAALTTAKKIVKGMKVFTIGHGTRPADELVACLAEAGARTLVDVRRYPGSRRNPQFGQAALAETLADSGIAYQHAVELGGRLSGEPGEERFPCIRVGAFRSYAARMGTREWQDALAEALAEPSPCLMCAETAWQRCHRRLISELLVARGHLVVHLIRPGRREPHRLFEDSEVREGRLYLCGALVA
jgi:uncharacterized protein (DUF488 family)